MNIDQLLLWKYVDGLCTPEEILQVEAYLKDNPEKKLDLDSRMAFDSIMKHQELESPSMRFVQNVIEQTRMAQSTLSESLMSTRAKWIFGGMTGVFFLLYLISVVTAGSNPTTIPEAEKLIDLTSPLWSALNSQMVLMLSAISLAGVLYFAIDLFLTRKSKLS